MNLVNLPVTVRETLGKGPAGRSRRNSKVPAVMYGHSCEPVSLELSPEELQKAMENPYRRNTLFNLEVGGKSYKALVKDIQNDPISRKILHVDFHALEDGQQVEFEVPLKSTGKSIGIVRGGTFYQLRRTVRVRCTPQAVPVEIVMDVTNLDVGQKLTITDLPVFEGVTYTLRPDFALLQVKTTRAVDEPGAGAPPAAEAASAGEEKSEE